MENCDKEAELFREAMAKLMKAGSIVKTIEQLKKDRELAEKKKANKQRLLRTVVFLPFLMVTVFCFKWLILVPCPSAWVGTPKMVFWVVLMGLGWFIWCMAIEFYIDCRKWIEKQ